MGDSKCVRMEPCPSCGSRDNLGRFDDGHGYCFGCSYYEHGDSTMTDKPTTFKKKVDMDFVSGEHIQLKSRGISDETAKKFDYTVGSLFGKAVQVANYRDKFGEVVAQKIRFKNNH